MINAKYTIICIMIVLIFTGLGQVAFAKECGYVDVQKALNSSQAGRRAKEFLTKKVEKYQKEIGVKQDELRRLKSKNEVNYDAKLKNFQEFTKAAQDDLQKNDDELTKQILKAFETTVLEFQKGSQYRAIYGLTKDGALVKDNIMAGRFDYPVVKHDAVDLTEQMVDVFNNKRGSVLSYSDSPPYYYPMGSVPTPAVDVSVKEGETKDVYASRTVENSGVNTVVETQLISPPSLATSITFSDPSGNNVLDAEETGKLSIKLENTGSGDANEVNLDITATKEFSGLTYDKSVKVGNIPAGKSITKDILLKTTDDLPSDNLSFTVEAKEANGFDAQPVKISLATRAFEPPSLIVADIGINDQSGGIRVEPGKLIDVVARVQNVGRGIARNVVVDVEKGDNVFFGPGSETRFNLGDLLSGKFTDVRFQFLTNNRIKNGVVVPLTIKIAEAHPRYTITKSLTLVMNAPQKSAQEFVVKANETERTGEIRVAGGLSVDVDMDIPEGTNAGKYDVAVVIGNRNYGASGAPDVEYALRDAQIMREYLTRTMGYAPNNILYSEDASLTKFNELFGTERDYKGKLFKFVKPGESRVFIYYVGHGAPDLETNEAYFVPVDANPQYLKSNGYRLQTFYENLGKIPAKQMTVVLDSCFSGNSEKGMLFKNVSPAMVKVKAGVNGPDKAVVMTSAGLDQVSSWYPEKKHSLFTYFFLKGLQGEADPGRTGKVTVGGMRKYLQENVPYMARRLTGNEQQPLVTGNDDEVLAVVKR